MYRIVISQVDKDGVEKFGVSRSKTFYLQSSDEVCDVIKALKSSYFISLIELEFDTVDSVLSSLFK